MNLQLDYAWLGSPEDRIVESFTTAQIGAPRSFPLLASATDILFNRFQFRLFDVAPSRRKAKVYLVLSFLVPTLRQLTTSITLQFESDSADIS